MIVIGYIIYFELLTERHVKLSEAKGPVINALVPWICRALIAITRESSEVNIDGEICVKHDVAKVCLEILNGLNQHDACIGGVRIVVPIANIDVTHAYIHVYRIYPVCGVVLKV